MKKLSNEQIEVIKALWSSDNAFRELVSRHVKDHALRAHKEAQGLLHIADRAQLLFSPNNMESIESMPETKREPLLAMKPSAAKRGRVNHRGTVSKILKENPGLTVSEIKERLDDINHPISNRVLNSLLNQWKSQYFDSGGKKGLRTSGEAPFTKFFSNDF